MRGEDEFDPQQNSERELSVIGQSASDRALVFPLVFRVFLCVACEILCVFEQGKINAVFVLCTGPLRKFRR